MAVQHLVGAVGHMVGCLYIEEGIQVILPLVEVLVIQRDCRSLIGLRRCRNVYLIGARIQACLHGRQKSLRLDDGPLGVRLDIEPVVASQHQIGVLRLLPVLRVRLRKRQKRLLQSILIVGEGSIHHIVSLRAHMSAQPVIGILGPEQLFRLSGGLIFKSDIRSRKGLLHFIPELQVKGVFRLCLFLQQSLHLIHSLSGGIHTIDGDAVDKTVTVLLRTVHIGTAQPCCRNGTGQDSCLRFFTHFIHPSAQNAEIFP